MKPKLNPFLILGVFAGLVHVAFADRTRNDSVSNLNVTGAWTGDVAPNAGDIALWDADSALNNTLGGNLTWGGLNLSGASGAVTIQGANSLALAHSTAGNTIFDVATTDFTWGDLTTPSVGSFNIASNGAGAIFAGSSTVTIGGTGTKTWAISSSTFTGNLVLRGGSAAAGAFSNNWVAFGQNNAATQTGSFSLDTGASLTNRGEFIVTDAWGDGTSRSKLTLNSLSGYGDLRTDYGAQTFRTVSVNQSTDTTFNGRIVNSSTTRGIDLEKLGSGTLTLAGANAHRNTLINGGTLAVTGGAAIADSSAVILGNVAGATFLLNQSETIGSLQGGGAIGGVVQLQGNTLTVAETGTQSFAGVISGEGGSLTKSGAGFLTLAGASTYTGSTLVSAGRLNLSGSLASAISVGAGASISGSGSTSGLLTMNEGSSILLAGGGTTTSLTANGVNFAGATTFSFLNVPLAGVYDVVTFGSGPLTNASNLTSTARGSFSTLADKIIFTSLGAQARTWAGGSGTWATGDTNRWNEGDQDYFEGDTVTFNDSVEATTVTIAGSINPGSVVVNNSSSGYTFNGTGAITGAASLTKSGSGTLTIASRQTYTGGTIINGGILDLTNVGGGMGAIRGSVTVNSGGMLRLSVGDATGFNTDGTRVSVINLNGGTLHVNTGANQTLGSAVINMTGGSITGIEGSNLDLFANGSAINTLASDTTSTISVPSMNLRQDNTVFNIADGGAAVDLLISSKLGNGSQGNHRLLKQGAGTMVLSGVNTYNGGTEILGGTLSVSALSGIGTGYLAIKNGSTFQYTGTGSETRSGQFYFDNGSAGIEVTNASAVLSLWKTSGGHTQTLVKTGAGTLRYGANGDNTGASAQVNAGVLESISSSSNNFASVTVNSGGTFRLGTTDGAGVAITADHQIWNGGSVTLNAGSTFDQNGMNETIGTLGLNGGAIVGGGVLSVATAINAQSGSSATSLAGNAGFNKTTVGTVTLSGANSYGGITEVSAGTLLVNGVNSGTGAVNVASGAILGGSGRIAGNVNVSGVLAPGTSIESLHTGSVAFAATSTFAYELDSVGLNGDLLAVSGGLSIAPGAILTLTDLASGTLPIDSKLTLISYTGGWTGGDLFTYQGGVLNDGDTITLGSNQWQFNYDDSVGGINFSPDQVGATNFVTMTVVPEPTVALLGSLGLLALLRRRRA
jgi:fibronectin-binding autotransporter adhesin